jgi:antitoxin (DNA-binding transcriptional repressor) of toxin-antitoxin stability system
VDNPDPDAAVRHHGRVSQHAYELSPGEDDLGRIADDVAGGEVVYLTRNGEQVAAVIPLRAVPAALDAIEDAEDEAAARAALAEWAADGHRTIPAEQVWAEFDS